MLEGQIVILEFRKDGTGVQMRFGLGFGIFMLRFDIEGLFKRDQRISQVTLLPIVNGHVVIRHCQALLIVCRHLH